LTFSWETEIRDALHCYWSFSDCQQYMSVLSFLFI